MVTKHLNEILTLVSVLVALAGGVIWLRTATVRDTYQYVKQGKEFQNLQQEIQVLRIEWLNLTAPKRLEVLARELDLHPPTRQQVVKYVTQTDSSLDSAAPAPRVTPDRAASPK